MIWFSLVITSKSCNVAIAIAAAALSEIPVRSHTEASDDSLIGICHLAIECFKVKDITKTLIIFFAYL